MAGNVIQLTIRVDDKGKPVVETFVNDTKKGMTEVEKSSTGASTALGNLKKAAGTALTALAAVGGAALTAATSGLALARNAAQAGDQAYVLGQQLGISAEKASELDYWARSNSSSTEAMTAAMRALALSSAQAAAGSKQDIAAFKAIGLTVDQVNPSLHSMDEIFRTVVGAMDRYAESGNKTAASTVILGRGLTELKPALAGGVKGMDDAARAGRVLGVIFTDEAASAAHELNNSFDDLRAAVRGVTNAVGIDLFPMVKRAVNETTEWIKKNKDLIATKVERFITAVVEAGKILGPIIRGAAGATLELLDRLTKVNPELLKFAAGTAAVVGGAGLATSGLQSFVETGSKVVDTSLNVVANFKAINANSMLAKAGLTSLSVAGFTAVASAGALLVLKIQDLNRELGELAEQSSKYLAGIQAMNPELRTLTMTQAGFQQALSKSKEELQAVEAKIQKLNSQTFSDVTESSAELEAEAARLREQITHQTAALDKATQKLQDYGKGQKKAAALTVEVADATLRGVSAHKENVGAMDASGDAAAKAAKEAAALAEKLASVSSANASYAIQQIELAGETGDLVAIEKAHDEALAAVEKQFAAATAAIKANAAAGEDQKLIEEEQIRAAQQHEDGLRAVTKATAAAIAVTKQYALEQEQVKLDQLALEADQASAALGKLVRSGAGTVAIERAMAKQKATLQAAYQQEIRVLDAQVDAVQDATKKTGVSAAVDVAKARALAKLNDALEQVDDTLRNMDPWDSLTNNVSQAGENFAQGIKEAFGGATKDTGSSLTEDLSSMWDDVQEGFKRDIEQTGIQAIVSEIRKPIEKIRQGIGHAFNEMFDELEGVLEAGWDAITDLFGGGTSRATEIAREFSQSIQKALEDPQIAAALDAGLNTIGLKFTPALAQMMIDAPKKAGVVVKAAYRELGSDTAQSFSEGFYQDMKASGSKLIHSTVTDVLNVLYPELSATTDQAIQQSALAVGAQMARAAGKVGDAAIEMAREWAVSFLAMAKQTHMSAEDIQRVLTSMAGSGGALYAALDALNADIGELGSQATTFFQNLNADLSQLAGKKVHVGNLDDAMTVLTSLGYDSATALVFLQGVLAESGIQVEQFGSDWTNTLLAISGDAGSVIRDASKDMEDFGNTSDGTAQILEQRVVDALGQVVSTAEELGYTPETIQAIGAAAAQISPELLKSDSVVRALHDDFAQMAVGAHMSIRELVDSIDPPLPAAVREAILSVDALGTAIGALSGAPLRSLKEVTDRMKQFSGELYVWVEENGKQVQKLTTFGEQVVGDVVSAVNGMWNTINEDSWVGLDEVGKAFAELGNIPAEALNDPAIQTAIKQLFAKMGEALGDAQLIAWANADTITSDMIAEGTKKYDEYVAHVEGNPPVVPPPETSDGTPVDSNASTDPTQDPTAAATGAPPPQPIPAETTASYQVLADTATEFSKAVLAGSDAVAELAKQTGLGSATILAAIQPIIGTVGDGTSLTDMHDLLGVRVPHVVDELTQDILGATGVWKGSFDFARGAVEQLTGSVDALKTSVSEVPRDITITTHYVSEGTPPTGGGQAGDGIDGQGHTGAIVPGYPSTSERLYKVLPGEVLIPPDHDLSAAIRAAGSIESGIANYTAGQAPGRGGLAPATPSGFQDGGGGHAGGDVAGEVVSRLTHGGAIAYVPISRATMRDIADGVAEIVVLDKLPRLSAAGAVRADPRTGVIKRSSTIPGPG